MRFKGKTVVVTGGTRGIGNALVKKFVKEGANVVINYLSNDDKANKLIKDLEQYKDNVVLYKCSVTDYDEVKKMISFACETFGDVHILVNNAGIEKSKLLMHCLPEEWNEVIDTNLTGTFNCCKSVLSRMISNKYGRIINISSVAGARANPGQGSYSASKAAIDALTRVLAKEVASFGITVNSVAPGFVATEMTTEFESKYSKTIPLKRFGTTEEIADFVAFVASEEASYQTGQVFAIDGGLLA